MNPAVLRCVHEPKFREDKHRLSVQFLSTKDTEFARIPSCAIEYGLCKSPFGPVLGAWLAGHICYWAFVKQTGEKQAILDLQTRWPSAPLRHVENCKKDWQRQIDQALSGSMQKLTVWVSGTDFQIAVWQELLTIPRGEVRSYQQVADKMHRGSAVRSIASAIGANRVGLLIPCHRVVRSDGSLGGYRWGLECKQQLLAWEKTCLPKNKKPDRYSEIRV